MTQFRAELDELQTKYGVIVVETPPEVLLETVKAWDRVAARESTDNPDFAKVYAAQKAYAEEIIFSYRLLYPDTELLWDHYWPE